MNGDIVYCQTKYGKAKAVIEFYEGKFVAHWDSTITHPKMEDTLLIMK